AVAGGNLRPKMLEDVKLGVERSSRIHVARVFAVPAKGPALGALDPFSVNAPPVEDVHVLGSEVFANHRHDADWREPARGQREVRCRAANGFARLARRRANGVKRYRAYNDEGHEEIPSLSALVS